MKKIIILNLFLLVVIGCKKESNVCYECKDVTGNYLETVCGKNEQEAFDKSGIIGGTHDINTFRQYCHKK